ncbi:MAG: sigma-70 family RNA polymerase sigma factor [Acidobacteria bacterium]|nr:MAG: sigma-70 family RNA polymerase sigma factor [Acidobacteriota bacterium]
MTRTWQLAPLTAAGEAALVARLKRGDEAAYEELVRRYGGRLLQVARRYLREEDARDAVQDAFVSAFKAIDRFDGRAQLATWLHRIVVNASLMRLRRPAMQREESLEPLLPRFLDDGHFAAVRRPWPEDAEARLGRAETRRLVRRSIDRLPETYRTVLLLRDIEELDGAETAERLGISPGAVKVRLHRARQALRELLDPILSEGAA